MLDRPANTHNSIKMNVTTMCIYIFCCTCTPNLITLSCHWRNKNPNSPERERLPVIRIKSEFHRRALTHSWFWHFFSFLWEAATEIAFKTAAILPESNDTERHKQRVFSIHGLTYPWLLFDLDGKYHKDKKCFNTGMSGQLSSAAEWTPTQTFTLCQYAGCFHFGL